MMPVMLLCYQWIPGLAKKIFSTKKLEKEPKNQ